MFKTSVVNNRLSLDNCKLSAVEDVVVQHNVTAHYLNSQYGSYVKNIGSAFWFR